MSKVKRCFQVPAQLSCASTALLVLRLIAGVAFMYHGWGKIQSPMTWMGPESAVPGFLQFLGALAEFGGGIAWILGFLTPLASFGMAATMVGAVILHAIVMKDPFVNMTGGTSYELALLYLGISFLFLMIGPGKFSLDAKVFGPRIH